MEADKLCKHERKVKVVAHKGGQYSERTEAWEYCQVPRQDLGQVECHSIYYNGILCWWWSRLIDKKVQRCRLVYIRRWDLEHNDVNSFGALWMS